MTGTAEVAAGATAVVDAVGSVAHRPRAVVHLGGSGGVFAAREGSSRPVAHWGMVSGRPASALPALARHACSEISKKDGAGYGLGTYAGNASGLNGRLYAAMLSCLAIRVRFL